MAEVRAATMTVGELIEVLGGYPTDLPVVIDGYEGGVEDVAPEKVAWVELIRGVNDQGYYGPHEIADEYQRETHPDAVPVPAVLITRNDLRAGWQPS